MASPKPILRVTEAESIQVGRRYLVPCVHLPSTCPRYPWIPVLGEAHTDADLGVPAEHWHYDLRFFNRTQMTWTFPLIGGADAGAVALTRVQTKDPHALTELRVLRCVQPMPEFPSLRGAGRVHSELHRIWRQFEKRHSRLCIDLARPVCPHRMTPLNGIRPNDAGQIVCPGHGLRWCATTGVLRPQLCGEVRGAA